MEANEKTEELINLLQRWDNGKYDNCCIILHFKKGTQDLHSISPLIKCENIAELLTALKQTENAIHSLITNIIDKSLPKS